jgi:hypothetical protein
VGVGVADGGRVAVIDGTGVSVAVAVGGFAVAEGVVVGTTGAMLLHPAAAIATAAVRNNIKREFMILSLAGTNAGFYTEIPCDGWIRAPSSDSAPR